MPRQAQKDPETVTNNDEDTRRELFPRPWPFCQRKLQNDRPHALIEWEMADVRQ